MNGRSVVGVGFGLALDVLGVLLIFSGSVAAGVAVLVISTIIVLGVIRSRGGGPDEGRRRSGAESVGFGGVYAGDAYAGDDDNGSDGGGDSGGLMEEASMVVVAETAAEVFRGKPDGAMSRGWTGCYHACGSFHDREGRR